MVGLRHVYRQGRRLVLAIVTVALLALAAVSPASADSFGRPFHANFDFTAPNGDICGIFASYHSSGTFNGWETVNSAGLVQFKDTVEGKALITNVANGKWVSIYFAHRTEDVSAVSSGPNLITVTTVDTGLAERITTSDGAVLSTDVGQIVFVAVVDDNGTPSNPDDDTLVSGRTTFEAGSHPDAESDNSLFCAEVAPALS